MGLVTETPKGDKQTDTHTQTHTHTHSHTPPNKQTTTTTHGTVPSPDLYELLLLLNDVFVLADLVL